MATVTAKPIKASERATALASYDKQGFKSLAGGLDLPVGTHKLQVADKAAFGILEVMGANDGNNWALPMVAGTVEVKSEDGAIASHTFTLDAGSNAKNLVIPNGAFLDMKLNGTYAITIADRKGRKVVTAVNSFAEEAEAGE